MLYNIRLYYNTGFDLENIPGSVNLLNSCSFTDLRGHYDLQYLGLTSLRLATRFETIQNADYLRIGMDGVGYAYYIITSRDQINQNMCIVSLELDALTTLGGASNINYIGGFIERAHPLAEDETNINIANESIKPIYPLIAKVYRNINFTGSTTTLIASTLDLSYFNIDETTGRPADASYIEYEDSENNPVLFIPRTPPIAQSTTISIDDGDSSVSYQTQGYGLYDASNDIVKKNIKYIVGLGLTGSLLYSYRPIATMLSTDSRGHVKQLGGSSVNGASLDMSYDITTQYRKSKFLYNKVQMLSRITGNTKEFDFYDVKSSDTAFTFVKSFDPSPEGKFYIRPKYYKGAETKGINEQAIGGITWVHQPITSMGSGSLIADNNYSMSLRGYNIEHDEFNDNYSAFGTGNIMRQLTAGGNMIRDMASQKSLAEAAGSMIGSGITYAGEAINRENQAGFLKSKLNLTRDKIRMERANARVQIPVLSCSPSQGLGMFNGINQFYVYQIRPINDDIIRFDEYFDKYGYSLEKPFSKAYLTSKSNFNYIQVRNIKVARNYGSIETRTKAEETLNGGIRIWHKLPNNNRSNE